MSGFNPNRKKKTYSYNRSQPSRIVATVINGNIEYFDQTLSVVESNFYNLDEPVRYLDHQYDEDVIDFDWMESKAVNFNLTFTSEPYVTLEILPANGFENVNVFASNLSIKGFVANVSAPFSGQIVYRAIYSTTYPIIIERVVASSSFYYTASAGSTGNNAESEFLATYPSLAAATNPTYVFFTPIDSNNNGDAGVQVVETGSFGLISTTVSFSAPVYNNIHYLAVKS